MNLISFESKHTTEPIQKQKTVKDFDFSFSGKHIESPFLQILKDISQNSEPLPSPSNPFGYQDGSGYDTDRNASEFRSLSSDKEYKESSGWKNISGDEYNRETSEYKTNSLDEEEEEAKKTEKEPEDTKGFGENIHSNGQGMIRNLDYNKNAVVVSEGVSSDKKTGDSDLSRNTLANSGNTKTEKEESDTKKVLRENGTEESIRSKKESLDGFEKKILTSKDLLEKLSDKISKLKSEDTDAKNTPSESRSEISESKESGDGNKLFPSSKNSKTGTEKLLSEKIQDTSLKSSEITEDKTNADNKQEKTNQNTEGKIRLERNFQREDGSQKENLQVDKRETSSKEISSREPQSREGSGEKPESNIRPEMNRWDLRKERLRQEKPSQASGNSAISGSKELSGIQSKNTGGESSQNGKEGDAGSWKMDFAKNLSGSKVASKDSSFSESSSLTSQKEIKENLEKLIKTAKIQIINQGKSQAEIRMNPEELGRMILKISVNKDKVEGKIFVESESVKSALQADMGQLKEDLKNNGLHLQSLSIDVTLDQEKQFADRKSGFQHEKGIHRKNEEAEKREANTELERVSSDSLLDIVA